MINFNRNNVFTFVSILILLLGFQNCGNSNFQNVSAVKNAPALSLIVEDTKFKGGLDFEVLSLAQGSTELVSNFKVSKGKKSEYNISQNERSYLCYFENPNSSEELLQLTEISTLSHPSTEGSVFDICDSSEGEDVYYSIGRQSKLYLVFKNEAEDCYSGDPEKLMDQDLRVYIVDNLFIDDIEELTATVEQDVLDGSNCAIFDSNSEGS